MREKGGDFRYQKNYAGELDLLFRKKPTQSSVITMTEIPDIVKLE